MAYKRRVQELNLRIEMMQARKESQAFSNLFEVVKAMDKIKERREKRKQTDASSSDDKDIHRCMADSGNKKTKRKFRQTMPLTQSDFESAKVPLLGSMI